jgi:NAD(P)H-dependent FMN reductase
MPMLKVVIASTRPERAGLSIASWFVEAARRHGNFEIEVIDLKVLNLPPIDEPNHPVKRQYQHEHTKAWSATVSAADAFVFVVPEYNHGVPPALVNAIDYLFHEWNYKPAAFVSYGGISGGTRSAQMLKPILTGIKMMPIPESVIIPYAQKQIDAGVFQPNELQQKTVPALLDELLRWSNALRTLRA